MKRILLAAIVALGIHLYSSAGEGEPRVHPGDDFFAWANADWLAKVNLPAGKGRYGARDEIFAATEKQVLQAIRQAGDSPHGMRVADFYAAYKDEEAIERKGNVAVQRSLEEIDRIRNVTDLSRYLGEHLAADVDPMGLGVFDSANPIGFAASSGLHGEKAYLPFLTQGGLGMRDREAYLEDKPERQVALRAYRQYVSLMLSHAGLDQPMERARGVVALETALARTHATAAVSSKETNANHFWMRGEFAREAAGLDWTAFFEAAGLAKQREFIVWQPAALIGTSSLAASQPIAVWKDYLRFHLLDREADVLPIRFASAGRAHRLVTKPRRDRALDETSRLLPEDVGRLYAERFFPPERKAKVQAILDGVVAVAKQRVKSAQWMTLEARTEALEKLDAMYFGVGYPERWQDFEGLVIVPHEALGNVRRIERWRYQAALAKLGQPVDRREWQIPWHKPNAILNFQLDSYNFAAALIQGPKFDPEASDAANYGAIGAIFAHEVTHFVDSLGADYDARGDARNWWMDRDRANHELKARALVDQFVAYRPLPDASIDGKLTLTENFADLSGLEFAFDAYRAALGAGKDPAQLKAMDREFFVGFAKSWRATMNEEALRAWLKKDTHAPERFRIATVRNLDAWHAAFDVKPGHALWLAPGERVRIW